jgi:glycosyltransferase involved in cell wall biosynthesis
MKIVLVSDYPEGMPYGGLQTHIYNLASHIADLNRVETHLVTIADSNMEYKINNLTVHLVKRPLRIPKLFTIPLDAHLVKKKILELNPDVVHVHGTHYPYNLIAGMMMDSYPTIVTVHGIMAMEYKFNSGLNFFGGLISYLLEKYTFNKVNQLIVCSKPMKYILSEITNAEINIIPNGIDYKSIDRITQKKSIEKPSIIYMGLLERIKGVDILINAIPLIKKRLPNIHVYIVGDGSQKAFLENLSRKLRVEDNVNFLGYINGDEKYSYLKSADVCVVPSRYESFGIVILESMSCGTPLVGTDIGNIPYLLENGKIGLSVDPDDSSSLADKIIELLDNKELQSKMKLNCQVKVKKFDWIQVAANTVDIYEKLEK